jgi:nicotinate-nucleotide adenylyltransferase
MGGTFDPIHYGHLLLAEQARDLKGLDEIWWIPAGEPPHKRDQLVTPAIHRLRMVELAIQGHPFFRCLDLELKRSGPSYTINTIMELKEQYPNFRFNLILGEDMVYSLPHWYRVEQLLELVSVIAIRRPGIEQAQIPSWIMKRIDWLEDAIEMEVSSTQIRQFLKQGRSIRYMVPCEVEKYIKEHRLYGI